MEMSGTSKHANIVTDAMNKKQTDQGAMLGRYLVSGTGIQDRLILGIPAPGVPARLEEFRRMFRRMERNGCLGSPNPNFQAHVEEMCRNMEEALEDVLEASNQDSKGSLNQKVQPSEKGHKDK